MSASTNPVDVSDLERQEKIKGVNVESTDHEVARDALIQTVAITRMSQVSMKDRLAALSLLLQYTKSRPATKIEATVDSTEDWLKNALIIDQETPKKVSKKWQPALLTSTKSENDLEPISDTSAKSQ